MRWNIATNVLGFVYLAGIPAIALGGMALTAWLLWHAGSPPDDSPAGMFVGIFASLALAFAWGHHGMALMQRILRRQA